MNKTASKRGGAREGAGRPSQGKKQYGLTLTETTVVKARKQTKNLSGLVDELLAGWLAR